MGQQKHTIQLDHVQFENVSFQVAGLDPVLKSVDIEIPMDQTVIVQATDPSHAVHLLEILAGFKQPQTGKVRFADSDNSEEGITSAAFHDVVSSYFEHNRPSQEIVVKRLFLETGATEDVIEMAVQHFELEEVINKKFKTLNFETQKLLLLVRATLRTPQMLVLEDPALGLSEEYFLNFLDWIQYWQRRGHLRHVFMTNNHPSAARHFDFITLFVDDGLIYVEQAHEFKKVLHF
jgi:ABC-type multidrug transport system ATPase subunit